MFRVGSDSLERVSQDHGSPDAGTRATMKPLRAADQGGTIDLPFNDQVLARLLVALDDRATSTQALGDLLLCDPALALHVLASAGPFPAAAEPSQSISMQTCLGVLGRDMLRALALLQLGKQLGNGMLPYPRRSSRGSGDVRCSVPSWPVAWHRP